MNNFSFSFFFFLEETIERFNSSLRPFIERNILETIFFFS